MKRPIADRLEALWNASRGSMTWRDVVADARDKASPLHSEFEWNHAKAHEIYLRERAQALVRDWYVNMQTGTDEAFRTRRLVSLPAASLEAPHARRYFPIESVLSDAHQRDLLLQQALHELGAFKRKYGTLAQLARVFEAIERTTGEVAAPRVTTARRKKARAA
jgi:hypothetical protein